MRKALILKACERECGKSTMSQRHGAILVYRSRIVASAHNHYSNSFARSTHAEVAVINKFLRVYPKRYLKQCTLYVVKMNRNGKLCNSTPCDNCSTLILKNKIPTVIFSTEDNNDLSNIGEDLYNKNTIQVLDKRWRNTYNIAHSLLKSGSSRVTYEYSFIFL